MTLKADILAVLKDGATEERPMSANSLIATMGEDQNRITGNLSQLMKSDPHVHRKQISEFSAVAGKDVLMYAYWFDATKKSDYFKARQKGEIAPRRSPNSKKAPDAAPASAAPIFPARPLQAALVAGVVFVQIEGKVRFCALDNFKEG